MPVAPNFQVPIAIGLSSSSPFVLKGERWGETYSDLDHRRATTGSNADFLQRLKSVFSDAAEKLSIDEIATTTRVRCRFYNDMNRSNSVFDSAWIEQLQTGPGRRSAVGLPLRLDFDAYWIPQPLLRHDCGQARSRQLTIGNTATRMKPLKDK